jgi:5'-nucleotidase
MNMQSLVVAAVTALGLLLAGSDVNAAGPPPFQCTTTVSNETINGTLVVPANAFCSLNNVTVNGNVQVEPGGTLSVEPGTFNPTSTSSTINGNITVASGGTLNVGPGIGQKATINGNITTNGCKTVALDPFQGIVSVEGNVNLQNCTGNTNGTSGAQIGLLNGSGGMITIGGNFTCSGNLGGCVAQNSVIHGNVTVDNNSNNYSVSGDQVNGNVTINGNKGPEGFFVSNNTISGNLACTGNSPAPSLGGGGSSNQVEGHKTGQCAGL